MVNKSEDYWKEKLSPEEYSILREKGTESPGTGKLLHNKKSGIYLCAGCGNKLFSSREKFESGSGWPSFWSPISENAVKKKIDLKELIPRTEVLCSKCDGHLGHVFKDAPQTPTGKRYCINSAALKFEEK